MLAGAGEGRKRKTISRKAHPAFNSHVAPLVELCASVWSCHEIPWYRRAVGAPDALLVNCDDGDASKLIFEPLSITFLA